MGRDEIVTTIAHERKLTNPQDVAWLREDVERVVDLYETPHRWVDGEASTSQMSE